MTKHKVLSVLFMTFTSCFAMAGGGGSGEAPIDVAIGANCRGSKIAFSVVDQKSMIRFIVSEAPNSTKEEVKIFYSEGSYGRNVESLTLNSQNKPVWILTENTDPENGFAPTNVYSLSVLNDMGHYTTIDTKVKCSGFAL